jgi:hypothetical protein
MRLYAQQPGGARRLGARRLSEPASLYVTRPCAGLFQGTRSLISRWRCQPRLSLEIAMRTILFALAAMAAGAAIRARPHQASKVIASRTMGRALMAGSTRLPMVTGMLMVTPLRPEAAPTVRDTESGRGSVSTTSLSFARHAPRPRGAPFDVSSLNQSGAYVPGGGRCWSMIFSENRSTLFRIML